MEELREQPIIMPAQALNPADDNDAMSEVGSQPQDGELGKFKSVKALMDAYDSLQAEFTKKCQLLSQLKKDKTPEDESQQEKESQAEENQFNEEDFQAFLSEFDEAKEFEEEIKNNLLSAQKSSPYKVAWAEVVLKSLKEKGQAGDQIINQYVLSDEKFRNKVLEEYFISLNKSQPPIVISSQSGERLSGVLPDSPKTLAEAKRQVEKLFS